MTLLSFQVALVKRHDETLPSIVYPRIPGFIIYVNYSDLETEIATTTCIHRHGRVTYEHHPLEVQLPRKYD